MPRRIELREIFHVVPRRFNSLGEHLGISIEWFFSDAQQLNYEYLEGARESNQHDLKEAPKAH